ncbi:MAG: hemin ABC transporter substrate-binding protein [Myxococcota bacterium]
MKPSVFAHWLIALVAVWLTLPQASLAGKVTDTTGAKVEVSSPERIVSLGGGITELVFALGLGDQVIAVDASSVYPPKVFELKRLPYHRQLSAEGILSLQPDLVVASDAVGPEAVVTQIRDAGLPIVRLPSDATVEGAKERIRMLAKLVDRNKQGKQLVGDIDRALDKLAKPAPAPRVVFIYARGGGTLNVAGLDTGAGRMVELAGGVNAVTGYTGYKPLTAESLVLAKPDVFLLTSRGLESLGGTEGLLEQPGVSLTPAGQNKRIVVLDDLLLLGFGPRVGEGVVELAKRLGDPDFTP